MINKYFDAFPAIGGFLDKLGTFGKKYGLYQNVSSLQQTSLVSHMAPTYIQRQESSFELGSIERASKNTPIQGASADMTKKALILIRDHIKLYNSTC